MTISLRKPGKVLFIKFHPLVFDQELFHFLYTKKLTISPQVYAILPLTLDDGRKT
jgi:hypothetical protein